MKPLPRQKTKCALELFGCLNRNLAEFLKILHKLQRIFTCSCAGSLIALLYLRLCVLLKFSDFSIDFCYKLFHRIKIKVS